MKRMVFTVTCWLVGTSAYAQSTIGGQGYVTFGSTSYAATDSFDAVGGKSRQSGWGGGGTVTRLWRDLFVDVAVSQQSFDGQRVFVDAGTVYPLDVPLTVRMRPVDVAAGWRFSAGRIFPYVGGGVTTISYKETGGFAASGDDVTEQKSGALALGGVDVSVVRWLQVGAELRYRRVSGAIGAAGVSELFGEDQLGGLSTALRISVGR